MKVRVKSYAKLNLTLGITGSADGYHNLDSLVCSVDLYDLIALKKRKDKLVSVIMHGMGSESIEFDDNNAVKAAEKFVAAFGTGGADIEIFKNIPMGAGLGGSSADAAGVLRGMSRLYGAGTESELKALADTLGSDTGYMLEGGFARLTGRGEKVERPDLKTRLDFLMLLPPSGVSTAECYRLYDTAPVCGLNSDGALEALRAGDVTALAKNLNNALYPAACKLNGDIQTAYDELAAFAPLGVNMTGSGSGVYAIFPNAEFCAWAKSRYRGKFRAIQLKNYIPKGVKNG